MTKPEAEKTLLKMQKAGNTTAKIVMTGVNYKGIIYAIKCGYKNYIR